MGWKRRRRRNDAGSYQQYQVLAPEPEEHPGEPGAPGNDSLTVAAPTGGSRIPEGWWEAAFRYTPNASEARGHRCGAHQMLTIVAYDITDEKRLRHIAKICEDFGVRVQYSIFECRLAADRFDRFWEELLATIDPTEDRLVAYKVCVNCARSIKSAGTQAHHEKVVAYVF